MKSPTPDSDEHWLSFDSTYDASTLGRIRKNGKLVKQSNNGGGYRVCSMHGRNQLVHRVIALTFLPNHDNKPTVNHKDGNRANNLVGNLEWATYSENTSHSFSELGRKPWNKDAPFKEKCSHGHDLMLDNVLLDKNGRPNCKTCNRLQTAMWKKRNLPLKCCGSMTIGRHKVSCLSLTKQLTDMKEQQQ